MGLNMRWKNVFNNICPVKRVWWKKLFQSNLSWFRRSNYLDQNGCFGRFPTKMKQRTRNIWTVQYSSIGVSKEFTTGFDRFHTRWCLKVVSVQFIAFFWQCFILDQNENFFSSNSGKNASKHLKSINQLDESDFEIKKHVFSSICPISSIWQKNTFRSNSHFLTTGVFVDFRLKWYIKHEKQWTAQCGSFCSSKEFLTGVDPFHTILRKKVLSG